MVTTPRLVLYHFIFQLVTCGDTLLFSPGSPASSTGFHQPLALVLAKHNSRGKDSKAQKHSLISINQSNELSTNTGQQDSCKNFMI